MEIAAILREIDAEIQKLQQAKKIIMGLSNPVPIKRKPRKQRRNVVLEGVVEEAEAPVSPPSVRRPYSRRLKAVPEVLRALVSVISDRPVFVPKAILEEKPEQFVETTTFDADAFEAALRQNLAGSQLETQLARA